MDAENQRLALGIKQLEPDKWEEFFSQQQVGDVVTGKVVRLTSFGVFVELKEGIQGLCHISELDEKRIETPGSCVEVDQELSFKIIKMNLLERKIGLSLKALKEEVEREDVLTYTKTEAPTTSLEELTGDQLDEFKRKATPSKQVNEEEEND
jgi:small subunit ribosomal protein S1